MARLSLCMLFVVAFLALGMLAVPTAQAAPPKPLLSGTDPSSPGTSLRPRIFGRSDGVITSVILSSRIAGGPAARAVDSDNTITIYADDPTCLDDGAIAAVGTAGELESVGIVIDADVVSTDSVHIFYATQADETGTSTCSSGRTYRQVTTPPQAPTLSAVSPDSPADDNLPRLTGTSADPDATIAIYSNSTCSGTPLATGTATAFAGSGIDVSVPDNSTTVFHAATILASLPPQCSSDSISYQEISQVEEPAPGQDPGGGGDGGRGGNPGGAGTGASGPAPKHPPAPNPPGKPAPPRLRTVPGGVANDNAPLLTGDAPGAARVEIFTAPNCKGPVVVRGSAPELGSGLRVQIRDNEVVTFYGISVDGGGDRSVCSSDPAVYVEDSTLPLTRITMGPGAKTRKRTAVFRFVDSAGETPGTTFFCKLDRRRWKVCQAPFRAKRLSRNAHVFRVRAVDGAGNREAKPVKRRFKVVS